MVSVNEVFGTEFMGRLGQELAAGYVRVQYHPDDGNLAIFNYTEKSVFDKHWNEVTLNTRGLILQQGETETYVVARPFSKFFNYGESSAPEFLMDTPVEVTDKMDGSLGIGYLPFGTYARIATRGSFDSDQAGHANQILQAKPAYAEWIELVIGQGGTPLFEIIYPENRIVVDYGKRDDLVLLGIVDQMTGKTYGPSHPFTALWPGPKARTFEYKTFAEALEAPPRPGQEGFVVRKTGTEDRVKLKQEEYVRLHKIVTNLNERAVWEILKDRTQDTWAWIAQLPDEFHDWATQVAHDLRQQYKELDEQIEVEYERINVFLRGTVHLDPSSRRDFAGLAKTTQYPWAMFARLDGKDCSDKIWQLIRPEAHKGPHGRGSNDS